MCRDLYIEKWSSKQGYLAKVVEQNHSKKIKFLVTFLTGAHNKQRSIKADKILKEEESKMNLFQRMGVLLVRSNAEIIVNRIHFPPKKACMPIITLGLIFLA